MPAEGRENPLLKKGNFDAFFREKYLTKNTHGIGRWYDAVKDRIGKGTASQSFMPAFRHEL